MINIHNICMTRINTTISLDKDIKEKGIEILKEKGLNLSFFVEQNIRTLIKDYEDNKYKEVI